MCVCAFVWDARPCLTVPHTHAHVQGFHVYEAEYAVLAALPPHPNIASYLAQFRGRVPDAMMSYLPPFVRTQVTTDDFGNPRRRPLQAQFVVGHRYADTLEAVVTRALESAPDAAPDAPPQLILPLRQFMALARGVCRAVVHMLRHGVVHRDLKLDNVFVGKDGNAVIGDFGCAIRLTGNNDGAAATGGVGGAAEEGTALVMRFMAGVSAGGNQVRRLGVGV